MSYMPAQRQVVYLVRCPRAFDKDLELRGPVRGWGRTPHPGNQAMDDLFAGPAQAGERPERAALPKPLSSKPPPSRDWLPFYS